MPEARRRERRIFPNLLGGFWEQTRIPHVIPAERIGENWKNPLEGKKGTERKKKPGAGTREELENSRNQFAIGDPEERGKR